MSVQQRPNPASSYRRSHEPIVWALFSGGGVVAAMLLPALILVTGLLVQLGLADGSVLAFERVHGLLQGWVGKLFVLIAVALPVFHAAHRICHGLHDLHVPLSRTAGNIIFYGGATAVSAATVFLLVSIG